MQKALEQAEIALSFDSVPVGAVIVQNDKIIASAFNNSHISFLHHAEICCIQKASKFLNNKYLEKCKIFITLEPCVMCYHAIYLSKIKYVFYGAFSENATYSMNFYSKQIQCYGGFNEANASSLLKNFFYKKRRIGCI